MGEGGVPNESPAPERGQQNPTEAPKGLLGKVANEAKRIVGEIKDSSQDPFGFNFPASPEAKKPSTPTEASKSFLQRFGRAILNNSALPLSVAFAINMFSPVRGDLAQGDYRSVAVKGLIVAGSALLPTAIKSIRGR